MNFWNLFHLTSLRWKKIIVATIRHISTERTVSWKIYFKNSGGYLKSPLPSICKSIRLNFSTGFLTWKSGLRKPAASTRKRRLKLQKGQRKFSQMIFASTFLYGRLQNAFRSVKPAWKIILEAYMDRIYPPGCGKSVWTKPQGFFRTQSVRLPKYPNRSAILIKGNLQLYLKNSLDYHP